MRLALLIVSAIALVASMFACYFAMKLKERTGERDEARRFATAALGARSKSATGIPPPGDDPTGLPMRIVRDSAAGLAFMALAIVSWVRDQPGRAAALTGVLTVASATLFVISTSAAHTPTGPASAASPPTAPSYVSSAPPTTGRRRIRLTSANKNEPGTDTPGLGQAGYVPAAPSTTAASAMSTTGTSTAATSPLASTVPPSCLLYVDAPQLLEACVG